MFDKTRLPYVVLDVVCVVLGMSRVWQRGDLGRKGRRLGTSEEMRYRCALVGLPTRRAPIVAARAALAGS